MRFEALSTEGQDSASPVYVGDSVGWSDGCKEGIADLVGYGVGATGALVGFKLGL